MLSASEPSRVPGEVKCPNRWQKPLQTPQNRLGAVSQQSGRVGKHLYAFSTAQIALDNIPTVLGRVYNAFTFTFEVLCPAKTTSPPSHTAGHQNRTCTPDSREQIRVRWRLEKLYPCVDRRFKRQYRAHRIRDGKISRFPLFHHFVRCPDRFPMLFGLFFIVFA